MKLFAAGLAMVAMAACTPASQHASVSSPSPSPASPSGSPVTDLPLSKAVFTCRLPITKSLSGGDYASYEGGFITFPEATYQKDPGGAIHSEYLAQDFATAAAPQLHGAAQSGAPFYDLAMKRWVPVGAGQASPDGGSYAYGLYRGPDPNAPFVIHVVDIKTGTDRGFTIPITPDFGTADGAWVGDFDGASVFFSSIQRMGPPQGVWRLDVATGAVHELRMLYGVAAIEGGSAWVNRIDPRDPEGPQTGRSGPRSNSIVRVDLASGQEMIWAFAAGHQVSLFGVDRLGAPIISDAPPPDFTPATLRLVSKPESDGITIYDGKGGLVFFTLQSDVQGRLWLGNDRGIYAYTPAVGLRKVFAYMHDPVEAAAMAPGGFCI